MNVYSLFISNIFSRLNQSSPGLTTLSLNTLTIKHNNGGKGLDTQITWLYVFSSVFPAEACDTIGGEACEVEMFPEVKPVASVTSTRASDSSEVVEREYMEYNDPKT